MEVPMKKRCKVSTVADKTLTESRNSYWAPGEKGHENIDSPSKSIPRQILKHGFQEIPSIESPESLLHDSPAVPLKAPPEVSRELLPVLSPPDPSLLENLKANLMSLSVCDMIIAEANEKLSSLLSEKAKAETQRAALLSNVNEMFGKLSSHQILNEASKNLPKTLATTPEATPCPMVLWNGRAPTESGRGSLKGANAQTGVQVEVLSTDIIRAVSTRKPRCMAFNPEKATNLLATAHLVRDFIDKCSRSFK
jgi:hypothetical protein